ncbi:MAG: thioesterase family protein [Ginsengibacter sp.]
MSKIKIGLPASFIRSFKIPVRITDLNYGDHVGNDSIVSIIHESRAQFLQAYHCTELDIGGAGLIMANLQIEFRKEIFYPSLLQVSIGAGNISKASFDLFYKLSVNEVNSIDVAYAQTGMVAYDYGNKKVVAIPLEFRAILLQKSGEY